MNRYGNRQRVTSILTSLLVLLSACGESTSPRADLPYTVALAGYFEPLRLIRSDGTTQILQCDSSCRYRAATWSRDGTKLALEATAYVNDIAFSVLYTANGDGSSPIQIATSRSWCTGNHLSPCTQTHFHNFDADWSADGRLVYALDDTAVVVSAADGSGRKILFGSADGVRQPRWGAGDRTITFLGALTGYLYSLQSADGSDVRLLSYFSVEQHGWAPDGSSIAMQVYIANIEDHAIYLVDPATGQTTHIVQASGPGFAWSPLGNELAIEKADSLFVVDRRGTLTFVFKGDFVNPVWSPDGRYFIGRKNDGLDGSVIEISRARGSRRVVVSVQSIANISVKQSTRWNGW